MTRWPADGKLVAKAAVASLYNGRSTLRDESIGRASHATRRCHRQPPREETQGPEGSGGTAEGSTLAMAVADVIGSSAVAADPGYGVEAWVTLTLARLRQEDDRAGGPGDAGDHLRQAVEVRHLTLLPSILPAVDPPEVMFDVLTAWRAAERQLAAIPEDSLAWFRVHAEIALHCASYQRLFREKL
jgi:hypothetical protein